MKYIQFIIFGTILAALFVMQIHNLQNFPVTRGFDAGNHIQYIKYLKTEKHIPLANEGWELYQAPLYYIIASLFANPWYAKLINVAAYIILIGIVFVFLKSSFKNITLVLTGTLLTGSLPVIIYMTPPISNEFFSAVMISTGLISYWYWKKKQSLLKTVFVGVIIGLALLSKATAFVLVATIFIDQITDHLHKKQLHLKFLIIIGAISLFVAGWFYFRNIITFGNPFVASIDFPQFAMHQTPGFRDIKFFTDLSGFFKMDLFQAHHYSLWAGTYFSWFFDGHNVVVPVQPFSKIGILLIVFSVPLLISFILGYIKELKSKNRNTVLLLYPVLLFMAYIIYNFKLPFYSTVKGAFLVSLIIPFVYFVVQSIRLLNNEYLSFVYIYTSIYSILIIKAFWILDKWYK